MRETRTRSIATAALFGSLCLCGNPSVATGQAEVPGAVRRENEALNYHATVNDAVKKAVTKWETACKNRDAAALAALYVKDGRIITGTGNVVIGADSIQGYFRRNLSRLNNLKLGYYEVNASGDLAYLAGYLTYDVSFPSGGTYPMSVPYSMALAQQRDGSWRIRVQSGGDFPAWFVTDRNLRAHMAPGEKDTVRVHLTDAGGNPMRNSLVSFDVEYGSGTISPNMVFTDGDGLATAVMTTSSQAGINAAIARASVLPTEPLSFRVTTEENH
ncbi:MAG TPA: SgcJ/EcaC family oxidoreductase [Gemmatimonadales bacterium]|jgi:uncharacterized protein (TIGR02246 family)|nr:SgcJ/EcaC family oxidoreductase [Gemmatimonadales bacterium]